MKYLLVFLLASCASVSDTVIPELPLRTLEISEEVPGALEYRWNVCVKNKIFGGCSKWETKKQIYDLRDKPTRDKLIATGFVATVKRPMISGEK